MIHAQVVGFISALIIVGGLIAMVLGLGALVSDAAAHGKHREEKDPCVHACVHAYDECVKPCSGIPGEDSNRCVMQCVKEHKCCICACKGEGCDC